MDEFVVEMVLNTRSFYLISIFCIFAMTLAWSSNSLSGDLLGIVEKEFIHALFRS